MGNILKFIFKIFVFVLPVEFCFAAGVFGGTMYQDNWKKYYNYLDEHHDEMFHEVTIIWDYNPATGEQSDIETITVREDFNWTINGYVHSNDYDETTFFPMDSRQASPYFDSSKIHQTYKTFKGLSSDPFGNTLYVDHNGYSLRQIKQDTVLYAQWS